jgi:hypothetical protein
VVRILRPKEAAAKTGRTLSAVYNRRAALRLKDVRRFNGGRRSRA